MRIAPYVNDETFCVTYGDGLIDLNLRKVVEFHRQHSKKAPVTAVPSPGRFGILEIGGSENVILFHEQPEKDFGWINGGFFILEPSIFDYIEGDMATWERQLPEGLAADGDLSAYRHSGFWRAHGHAARPARTGGDLELEQGPWKAW
ncbi:sugar phosphate nucleotidyltransferase [Aquibium sp. LZ166]|uniref:Sugar phosphate nucleotidyltransferase n=1 Tax=Aquibium pacificus TaxID=3153579 RepID=A0ABV3SRB1_9HYPH